LRIALISTAESISSYGLRVLSAVLKQAGFETRLLLLPRETEGVPWDGFRYPYADAVLDQVAELASDSGLIGISLMTNNFFNAVQITQRLRRSTSAPVVWGGIHPTLRPEECLQHADIVCVGEGEEALPELAQHLEAGHGYQGIANMWYQENGEVVRSPLRPLRSDLDAYPYPDYDLETSFVLHQGSVRPLTLDLLLHYASWPHARDSVPTYETLMSRGCSFRCAYCCNDAWRRVYPGQWSVRRRSLPHLIAELVQATARFPGFQLIRIADDEFVHEPDALRDFCTAYREALNLPFEADGFKPANVDEESIGLLVDAGMRIMHMGIQTGSMHTMHQVYHRPIRREQIVQATQVLHHFVDRLEPVYDLITDNPWETEQDQLETLALLLGIPRPYTLHVFSLTLFPGTELYARGQQEGLLQNESEQVYMKHYLMHISHSYINELLQMLQTQIAPRWLIALLAHNRVRHLRWVWLPRFFNALFRAMRRLEAAAQALWRGDWKLLRQHLRYQTQRPRSVIGDQVPGKPAGRSRSG
jgi:radical SAM superfamily enzyme YgiQ (UPF0313 family)